jgi:hypothetical protein
MTVTEEEARAHWCPQARFPFVRRTGDQPIAVNRLDNDANPGEARCLASTCMLWRWEEGGRASTSQGKGRCGLERA